MKSQLEVINLSSCHFKLLVTASHQVLPFGFLGSLNFGQPRLVDPVASLHLLVHFFLLRLQLLLVALHHVVVDGRLLVKLLEKCIQMR